MLDIYQSIFSTVEAFAYRRRNDEDQTMTFMEGAVHALVGYDPTDILASKGVPYAGLIVANDIDRVRSDIAKALEAGKPWDIAYQLIQRHGQPVDVRDRGCAIHANGAVSYLQGVVTRADAEIRQRRTLEQTLDESKSTTMHVAVLTAKITNSLKKLNMLSINARIEAARSGEAGRGFAIVAEEMKTLADQNTEWAQIISSVLKENERRSTELRRKQGQRER